MPKRMEPSEIGPQYEGCVARKDWRKPGGVQVILPGILTTARGWEQFVVADHHNAPGIIQLIDSWVKELLQLSFTIWDILGFAGVFLFLVLLVWGIRIRLERAKSRRLYACPRCGSDLYRVHRSMLDRFFVVWFFPNGRRYECSNPDCGWSALLHRGVYERMKQAQGESTPDHNQSV
jgi:hypothetical protein